MDTEMIDIVDKVNGFYDSAWNKLIITGSIAFGIVGVLVPLLIQWWQKRNLQIEKMELKRELEEQLKESTKSLFMEESNKLKNDFNKQINQARAMLFHIQGNLTITNQDLGAFSDWLFSATLYLECEDIGNCVICLQNIIQNLKTTPKEGFEDMIAHRDINLEKIFSEFQKRDEKNILKPHIQDLKLAIKQLKTRQEIQQQKR